MPIRLRLGLSIAAVTLLLVVLGGAAFRSSFRNGMERSLEPGLRAQYASAKHLVAQELATASDGTDDYIQLASEDAVTQLLDTSGKLLASTREAGNTPAIPRSVIRSSALHPTFTNIVLGREREPFRVLARRYGDNVRRIVVVATSLEPTRAAVSRVDRALVVGGGAAVLVAGVGGWLLAGAALRPVERMRRAAAQLSAQDSLGQLPVPATHDEIAALAITMNALLHRLRAALDRQRAFVA